MNLARLAAEAKERGQPVRAGLIGAGKFGSMFLSQVPTIPGLEVAAIADLDPGRAQAACKTVGWEAERTNTLQDLFTLPRTARLEFLRATGAIGASELPGRDLGVTRAGGSIAHVLADPVPDPDCRRQ